MRVIAVFVLALVAAVFAEAPPTVPPPAPPADAVKPPAPHQISIEVDLNGPIEGDGRPSNDPASGAATTEGATKEPDIPYFASYDATELSRMYLSMGALSDPVPGQPVWDGHDLRAHPQPMSGHHSSVSEVTADHHSPVIDEHGNVITPEPTAPLTSIKELFLTKKEEAMDEAAAKKLAAKQKAEKEKLGDADKEQTLKAAAEKATAEIKKIDDAKAKAASGAVDNSHALTVVLSDDEKKKFARGVFAKQQTEGLVKELTHMNVLFYVSRNQPFGLFLLCDCADDYDLAVAIDSLAPQLQARPYSKTMQFLSVSPLIASHFNLWTVFALKPPDVGQGPTNLGPNDILVGDSPKSNTKTVAVTFPAHEQNKYAGVTVSITNECCGDKFVLTASHLESYGFHLKVERVENKGDPGWGQMIVVRWVGQESGKEAPTAEQLAAAEKKIPKVPAVVIDNIPMGSMNEKFVFQRGQMGPIEARALLSFFDDFQAQTLPLFIRSQSPPALAPGAVAPAPTPGDVMTVYGSTFRSIVMDPTKDVLVLVYSPFCGGSHAVMPVFEQAALAMKNEANVQFVRFDKTQNDFPIRGIRIVHYPTLLLFPAGDFSVADYEFFDFDDYNGSKTAHQRDVPHSHYSVQSMITFVHEKGAMKTGTGAHFHLKGPDAGGRLHEKHGGARSAAHDHDHDHAGHTH